MPSAIKRLLSLRTDLSWCQRKPIYTMRRRYQHSQCYADKQQHKPRFSPLQIQMLSEALHKQIFKSSNRETVVGSQHITDKAPGVKQAIQHLTEHGLWEKEATILPDVELKLPPLMGENIAEHFYNLALEQTAEYRAHGDSLAKCTLPSKPEVWRFESGWTRYNKDGSMCYVESPQEQALVFDIECLMTEGQFPTMATAVSPEAWYSWCSDSLIQDTYKWSSQPALECLIPLSQSSRTSSSQTQKQLVVGHNVSFDRSFVKEQYYLKNGDTRFIDTMSMHIAISGFTSFQRVLFQASKKGSQRQDIAERLKKRPTQEPMLDEWKNVGSMNALSDVYQFYLGGEPLKKEMRQVFITGTMSDVREQFQELMTYCASDVSATHAIFGKLWSEFFDRFPHPVTLAGMLEMGTAYLPINKNWEKYITEANETYSDLQREAKMLLMRIADDACELLHDNRYKDDLWLWDLDWSVRDLKLNKPVIKKKHAKSIVKEQVKVTADMNADTKDEDEESLSPVIKRVLATASRLPKVPAHMPGYPAWYRELCPRLAKHTRSDSDTQQHDNGFVDDFNLPQTSDGDAWQPGPALITTQRRVTPKLLRLTWDGHPVHYDKTHGWGYLVLGRRDNVVPRVEGDSLEEPYFPIWSLFQFHNQPIPDGMDMRGSYSEAEFEAYLNTSKLHEQGLDAKERENHWKKAGFRSNKKTKDHVSSEEVCPDVDIPGCWFYKLPHKDGGGKNVGNPLAKDFQNRVEDGTLKAWSGASAVRALTLSKMCSYWKNNLKRIESQMVVWLKKSDYPRHVTRNPDYDDDSGLYGAILPRVIAAGTVTRRAVEATWLTASNAYTDRVGSELKAMIQAPPGYHFVGADVDSQELWIGAIIGDSHFINMHGCSALGWMTLQGKKSLKTDLHSKTAEILQISRDDAKVLNYARIYGAGQLFARRLLMQFNPRLGHSDAANKAKIMYSSTKGLKKNGKWIGGSESYMFNKLEEIARCSEPRTPVLGCKISRALEPDQVHEDFMTSRINWVVQSSAVDYLHLMLVCMRWLLGNYSIDGRFSISIHDEVRYVVRSEDRYRAALALQITNLLTRSMFAYKLGFNDLPQSVAFFSTVDIDKCLRKEVDMDCITPSNPHGLKRGYSMPHGEALDIHQVLELTGGSLAKHSKATKAACKGKQQQNNINDDECEKAEL